MILFVNACVRKNSRTKRLTKGYLAKKGEVTELELQKVDFPKVDEEFITKRDELIESKRFDHPMFSLARQFAQADEIVIAAPFWDLSFPAILKQYIEQISVLGITFFYGDDGVPRGLCKAKKLTYITTAGGEYFPEQFGFGYIEALARNFYGIKKVELIKATGLDVFGSDPDLIVRSVLEEIAGR